MDNFFAKKNFKPKRGGLVFSMGLLIMVVASLLYAWAELSAKYNSFDRKIGERQYALIKAYQQGEQILFYIDQSAQYSLKQSIIELAQNGGFTDIVSSEGHTGQFESEQKYYNVYECGKYRGFGVWYDLKKDESGAYQKNEECLDENKVLENMEYLFNKKLNEYVLSHPYDIPSDNYVYELRNELEITGRAQYPVKIYIPKKDDRQKLFENLKFEDVKPSEFNLPLINISGKPADDGSGENKKEPKSDLNKNVFVDFSDVESVDNDDGKKIDFRGVCPKGKVCILTKQAFRILVEAEDIALKKGVKLQVNSAYRTYERQKELWESNSKKYPDPAVRRKFVANPNDCGDLCPHFTGNAVDITLQGKTTHGMTSKDWDLLKDVMSGVKDDGGQPRWIKYAIEPWHFECCGTDRFARAQELAKKTGNKVTEMT